MAIHVNFQRMFHVLRIFGIFTHTWPPQPNIGKTERLLRDIYYYVAIFIFATVMMSMLVSLYNNRKDIEISMKSLSLFAAFTEGTFNAILCRSKRKQLQVSIYTSKILF